MTDYQTRYINGFEVGGLAPTLGDLTMFNELENPFNISISENIFRSGKKSLRVEVDNQETYATKLFAFGQPIVGRIYVYFETLPDNDINEIFSIIPNSGARSVIGYSTTAASGLPGFRARRHGSSWSDSNIVVESGVWYRIDFRHGGGTFDVQINGEAITQVTSVGVNVNHVKFGSNNLTGGLENYTIYFDDVIFTEEDSVYPLGSGFVKQLSPTKDGTHNIFLPGNFIQLEQLGEKNLANNSINAFTGLSEERFSSARGITKRQHGGDEYIELLFEDIEYPYARGMACHWSVGLAKEDGSATTEAVIIGSFDDFDTTFDIAGNIGSPHFFSASSKTKYIESVFGVDVSGWTDSSGPTWETGPNLNNFTSNGVAEITLPTVEEVNVGYTSQFNHGIIDTIFYLDKDVSGGSVMAEAHCLFQDFDNSYFARVSIYADTSMVLTLVQKIDGEESVLDEVNLGQLFDQADTYNLLLSFNRVGESLSLKARCWKVSDGDEMEWQSYAFVSSSEWAVGSVGIGGQLSSVSTGMPYVLRFSQFIVTDTISIHTIPIEHPEGGFTQETINNLKIRLGYVTESTIYPEFYDLAFEFEYPEFTTIESYLDCFIQKTQTITHSVDAEVSKKLQHFIDFLVRPFQSLDHNIDAVVSNPDETITHSIDAVAILTSKLYTAIDSFITEVVE